MTAILYLCRRNRTQRRQTVQSCVGWRAPLHVLPTCQCVAPEYNHSTCGLGEIL